MTATRAFRGALAALAAVSAMVPAAASATEEPRWTLRLHAVLLSPAGDETRFVVSTPTGDEVSTFGLSDGSAVGLEVEYRVGPRIGLEIGAFVGAYSSDFRVVTAAGSLSDSGDIDTDTLAGGVNFHFARRRRVDPYVGGFVAVATYDGIIFLGEVGRRDKLTFDDDVGFGVKAGVDLPMGEAGAWLATAAIRYSTTILESEIAGRDTDVDPFVASLGLGRRW